MADVGIPALMAFFLEMNAAVMLCMMLGFISHKVTALWDVRYASAHRSVGPLNNMYIAVWRHFLASQERLSSGHVLVPRFQGFAQ